MKDEIDSNDVFFVSIGSFIFGLLSCPVFLYIFGLINNRWVMYFIISSFAFGYFWLRHKYKEVLFKSKDYRQREEKDAENHNSVTQGNI